jgi:DNA helicase-2/ATP-dependent DNA helicase PcrA
MSSAQPSGFTIDDLCRLLDTPFSEEQRAAIAAPLEPFVIKAGAGTGKTTVMTARVVWLVATGQVQPEQILGLTFTTKATAQLQVRVRSALRRLSDEFHGVSWDEVGEPHISTYHAFAGRLIAEHGLRLGVEPGSSVLTEAASIQLAYRVVTQTKRDLSVLGYAPETVVSSLRSLDGEMAEHGVTPERLRQFDEDFQQLADHAGNTAKKRVKLVDEVIENSQSRIELSYLVEEYRTARRERDVMDFSDQMLIGMRLATEFTEVSQLLREQYQVVLLDEYQDTSVAQRMLLTGLFGGGHPVTAVGDPLQAIYEWRGASVANIDDFPTHFPRVDGTESVVLNLRENRRSGANILRAANDLSEKLRVIHDVDPLVSPEVAKPPGEVRIALLSTFDQEVGWLSDQISGLVDSGVAPQDIAVLVRVARDLGPMVAALTERGLPVDLVGFDGLLALPEVAEVIAILDVLHDSAANPSMVRLLTGPRWRIGPRDLALLGERAADLAGLARISKEAPLEARLDEAVSGADPADIISLLDAIEDPGDLAFDPVALDRFAQLSEEIRYLRRSIGDPLPDLVHKVIVTTGLDIEMAASPEVIAASRAENLAAFTDLIAGFADVERESSLAAFLAWLRLAQRFDKIPELDRPSAPNAVQLMTVHRSKGLEWPVVVLPSMTAKVFPSDRARDRWPAKPGALPYPLRGDGDSLPRFVDVSIKGMDQFKKECSDLQQLEERRLGYVAVTRAESLLIASASWWGPHQVRPRGPSEYLLTLYDACIDGAGQVVEWAGEPDEDATNPALDENFEHPWPVEAHHDNFIRRSHVADAVRESLGLSLEDVRADYADEGSMQAPRNLEQIQGWDDDIAMLLEERSRERSQSRVVPLPASLSASDLVRLAADPDGFTRQLARPMPAAPAGAARRGTRFHAWVESHFGIRPLLDPADLPGAADSEIDSDEELEAMQRAFLASPYAEQTPVDIEVEFNLVLAGRVIPGRIDAVFATHDPSGEIGYEVIDWKTSRQHNSDPLQLAIYRIAYAELMNVPVERVTAAFVYVRDGAVVRFDELPDRQGLEQLLST